MARPPRTPGVGDWSGLIQAALDAGFVEARTPRNHRVYRSPSGQNWIVPLSPSDANKGWLNARAQLRRLGVPC